MSKIPRLTSAAVAVGVAATLAVAPASAARHSSQHLRHHVLASGLVSPLRAAVRSDGTAYVSENFVGKIDRISPDGKKRTIYTEPHGYEVGGLSLAGRDLIFTVTRSNQATHENSGSWLKVLTRPGHARTIANLRRYEVKHNPDRGATYGFADLDPSNAADAACLAKWPTADNGPAISRGGVDSHPYATYTLRNGWIYVADAGGNDVLKVSPNGRTIRTVATLPPIPLTITAPAATGMGLDPCFVGTTYYFEPVPTDVEVGRGGTVYVSSLPGGPEGPQLGARGSVFAIHAGHHAKPPRLVVRGLLGPTGLAVTPRGDLYVAQLFGDMVSKVRLGRHGSARVRDLIHTTGPGEVEWTSHGLYVTQNVLSGTDPTSGERPNGQLVRYRS